MTRVVALYTVTMSPDDEDLLRLLHQNLQQDEVSPHDRRYVPLHEHPASFGPDVIKELVRDVTWTAEGSVFFLSGLRGSGKSTQLLRLRELLAESGFAAVRLGIDKENPQSNHFWRKNGFAVLRKAAQERGIVRDTLFSTLIAG